MSYPLIVDVSGLLVKVWAGSIVLVYCPLCTKYHYFECIDRAYGLYMLEIDPLHD